MEVSYNYSRARLTAYARLAFEIQTPEATPVNFNTATVQGVGVRRKI